MDSIPCSVLVHSTLALVPTLSAPRFSSPQGHFIPVHKCAVNHVTLSSHLMNLDLPSAIIPLPAPLSKQMPWKSHLHSLFPTSPLICSFHCPTKMALVSITKAHHIDKPSHPLPGLHWPQLSAALTHMLCFLPEFLVSASSPNLPVSFSLIDQPWFSDSPAVSLSSFCTVNTILETLIYACSYVTSSTALS